MFLEIGGNMPLTEAMLQKHASDKEVWGCEKFKHNLYTFSARSALSAFLGETYKGSKKVLLPIFTCETCITPFINRGFTVAYYTINNDLSINVDSLLEKLEAFGFDGILYIHSYFGFDTLATAKPLLKQLREKKSLTIINDYTQSWLNNKKEIEADFYIASLRKWFPTPDGGVISSNTHELYSSQIKPYNRQQVDEYITASLLKNRFLARDSSIDKSQFYPLFKHTIEYFEEENVYAMSPISKAVYDYSDYNEAIKKRIENAKFLCDNLSNNIVERIFTEIPQNTVPFYYPIYVKDGRRTDLQKFLIKNSIFCTIHWMPSKFIEAEIGAQNIYPSILSLVCDQRYNEDDMDHFVKVINSFR